ncbi:MAG TPA: glycoside hydrolase family 172 protein [Opitutaceae bacterium]|nr:glycoside hydrolase family 172 protein [Opitutaceae bacterium]
MRPLFFLATVLFIFGPSPRVAAQPLYQMPAGGETRWASPENPAGEKGGAATTNLGRKGRASLPLKAGQSCVLAEAKGTSGTIRRIWMTINERTPETLRGLRIDFYWDGGTRPAASAPLGDFFGVGLGRMAKFESALFADPEGRSFNCFVPMPFRTGMKIVLTNESGVDIAMVFYDVDYTLGDRHGDEVLYFHAWFNRENLTEYLRDYTILPKVSGRGRFLGVNVGVVINQKEFFDSWWGEGEVKIYLDGDSERPTLCGTGTEDYLGSAWGLGAFSQAYTGCTLAEGTRFCFYRWHVPDPVYFHSDLRVTLQQIGLWDPRTVPLFRAAGRRNFYMKRENAIGWDAPNIAKYGLMERRDDVSSCAYFYLDRPDDDLPPLIDRDARIRGLESGR